MRVLIGGKWNWSGDSSFDSIPGGHGGGSTRQQYKSADGDAHRVLGLHDSPSCRTHARADDQHLHPPQHRDCLQSPQYIARSRVATRETSLVSRARFVVTAKFLTFSSHFVGTSRSRGRSPPS